MSMTPEQERDAILVAWNKWRIDSNAAKTDNGVAAAFDAFCTDVEPIAVANGNPGGYPKRKL